MPSCVDIQDVCNTIAFYLDQNEATGESVARQNYNRLNDLLGGIGVSEATSPTLYAATASTASNVLTIINDILNIINTLNAGFGDAQCSTQDICSYLTNPQDGVQPLTINNAVLIAELSSSMMALRADINGYPILGLLELLTATNFWGQYVSDAITALSAQVAAIQVPKILGNTQTLVMEGNFTSNFYFSYPCDVVKVQLTSVPDQSSYQGSEIPRWPRLGWLCGVDLFGYALALEQHDFNNRALFYPNVRLGGAQGWYKNGTTGTWYAYNI